MSIKIYKLNASPPARAAMMVAELLKLNYQAVEVNVLTKDNYKPEYLQKNPLHTVPLLEDGDFILSDSHAIITYLVSKYGAEKRAELYPGDLRIRATIDSRLYFDASKLFPKIQTIVRGIIYDKATEISEKQIAEVNEVYDFVESYLQESTFLASDHLTLADISCVSSISTLDTFVPVEGKFEKVHDWWNRLKGEEWYKKANELGLAAFSVFMNQFMEKNANSA